MNRHVWTEIDLQAIKKNLELVKSFTSPDCKILVVVKADGYGHGMAAVSRALIDYGVDYLGVGTVSEGAKLREERVNAPLLVFGTILPEEVRSAVEHDLILTVFRQRIAKALDEEGQRQGKIVPVHIKVDTGMGRLGVWHEQAPDFIEETKRLMNLNIEGVYTHFPSAEEEDTSFTYQQIGYFNMLIEKLEKKGIYIPYKHAANSMGLVRFKQAHFNLVRPGIVIYGLTLKDEIVKREVLNPALSFKTRVISLKETPKDRSISYGRTYTTEKDTLIATLPVGYSHGYARSLSNRGQVLIRGKRAPVVGMVCMDQMMVDVGHVEGVQVGDEVVLIGKQGDDEVRAEELAELCGTIPYEIVCGISRDVPRVYLE